MKKDKIIYIGCPYTHEDKSVMEERYQAVTNVTAFLVAKGWKVFSPITYGHLLCQFKDMPKDFEFWKDLCISFLSKADVFISLNLDGYLGSRGLAEELEYCEDNGIYIIEAHNADGSMLDMLNTEVKLDMLDRYLSKRAEKITEGYEEVLDDRIRESVRKTLSMSGSKAVSEFDREMSYKNWLKNGKQK